MQSKMKFLAYTLCIVLVACVIYTAFEKPVKPSSSPEDINSATTSDSETPAEEETAPKEDDGIYTVLSHDLGYFNYSTKLRYQGEDYEAQAQNWKEMISRNKADFYLCQELQNFFDKDRKIDTLDLYSDTYKNNISYANTYGSIGIFSDYRLVDDDNFILESTMDSFKDKNRPVAIASTKVTERQRVWLASLTLFAGERSEQTDTARIEQLEYFFKNRWIKNSRYAIIAGNFNTTDENLIKLLNDNGFELCLKDPSIDTLNNKTGKGAIDNIAVKGFDVLDAKLLTEESCTSNHFPIMATLQIKDFEKTNVTQYSE